VARDVLLRGEVAGYRSRSLEILEIEERALRKPWRRRSPMRKQ
jgi:hypothetical protein